jgi:hypothetical protein
MTTAQIKAIQQKIGVNPDGNFGKRSREAVKRYLTALMPKDHPFPFKEDRDKFFGGPGPQSTVLISVDGLGVEFMGAIVKQIRCHYLISDILKAALVEISKSKYAYILEYYMGCFMERNSRGSTAMSNHSYGIAIDFKLPEDGFRTKWPDNSPMPFEVMEIFAKHGFLSAGAFWGYDAMHFEAIRPKN